MRAYLRKDILKDGLEPDFLCEREHLRPVDWSQTYECWQPDFFDGFNDGTGYNMLLLIYQVSNNHKEHGIFLVWVNSFDFDFQEASNDNPT